MTKSDQPKGLLPGPLLCSEPGSFAHFTVTVRLPNILRVVLAENAFPAQVEERLKAMLAEIPQGQVQPLEDPGAPDVEDWAQYVIPYLDQVWVQLPWFFAETYFYRRILEATGYFQPGPTLGLDPFIAQKRRVLAQGEGALRALSTQVHDLREQAQADPALKARGLKRLIGLNLWGNQADLSMWSVDDEGRPEHTDLQQQEAHLLVDDSAAIVEHLLSRQDQPRVDFILDNAGPELLFDLALTDYLLATGTAGTVRYHLKLHPTFVSDAMIKDVVETVGVLAAHADPRIRALADRLRKHLEAGRLQLQMDRFWNSPLPMWEMPARVRRELERSDLLISKGDANYRRLLGDLHWPPTTPAADVLRYAPAPLAALRVAKGEIVVGLQPGQPEALFEKDPNWMVDGQWGLIQFVA
jgi:uncharacterized protein with ATP-grasp and redox domains